MALRFVSRRPLAERRERLRRHYGIVCWLICVFILACVAWAGSRRLPQQAGGVLTWCLIGLYMVWLAMSGNLLIWSAVLWARGRMRRGPAEPPESPGWPDAQEPNRWFGNGHGCSSVDVLPSQTRSAVPAVWREKRYLPDARDGRDH